MSWRETVPMTDRTMRRTARRKQKGRPSFDQRPPCVA